LKDTRILHKISFNVKLYLQYLWHYDFEIFKEQCSIYAGSRRGVPREVLKISLTINSTGRIFTSQVLLLGKVNTINATYCQVFILIKAAFMPLIQEQLSP